MCGLGPRKIKCHFGSVTCVMFEWQVAKKVHEVTTYFQKNKSWQDIGAIKFDNAKWLEGALT